MAVYIIQDQKWVDPKTGQLRPKFDFEPAREHGELVYVLKPSASPFDLEPVLKRLHQALADFGDDDFLLLTGNPVLLGLAVAVAADYNEGRVAMLQWSGAKGTYIPVRAEGIFPEAQEEETDCGPEDGEAHLSSLAEREAP